ncbi:Bifunctional protein GlmU [Methylacidimicrobium cyclopophantes]|uniref:Bifunctional protein GlmU n=1 Tax=Methylacidimicrobium cyclopophantes TaxID=1041766 RepID=A0A5E6MJT0_9BACT|nr:UDP-N-acetylglucosamine diphosphorylase [Methylacidimicrobium cyclopophantes]VVM05773.1 Bifunctional protein GlmU [Methylacidimicrobium cyclopophantes]
MPAPLPPFSPESLLDFSGTAHSSLFQGLSRVWEVLPRIARYLDERLEPALLGEVSPLATIGPRVRIEKGCIVEAGAVLLGPAWIGENCTIRPGAFVRQNVIVGCRSVLGNSCEFKNALLFNDVQVPHFNYVGDSILGAHTHLGAGAILSNLRLRGDEVQVRLGRTVFPTGLRKFGAILGDHSQVGCNAVLNPGSILGRGSLVYPGVVWSGYLPEGAIAKAASRPVVVEGGSADR